MSSDQNEENPLKKLLSGISDKISEQVERNKAIEQEKNANLYNFANILESSIQTASEKKEDPLYKLQLKEEKVTENFLQGITNLIKSDVEKIKKEKESVDYKEESNPLKNFVERLGNVLENPEKGLEPESEETEIDYLSSLDQVFEASTEQLDDDNISKNDIQSYIEDLFTRFKTQISTAIGFGGGGGTNAVNYAKGGTIDGTLDITGQILSGGEDLDSIFVNESGDTMTGDLNILANLSAQEIEVNQAYTFPTTAPLNTQVIVNEDGTLIWGQPEKMHLQVRNNNSRDLPTGTPIFVEDEIGNSDRLRVCAASACDPSVMPAIGILETALGPNEDGFAIINGVFNENISGFTGLDEGDVLYVGEFGGLTNIKPEGPQCLIQNIGTVVKTNGTKIQGMKVSSIDRTNDIPNLSAGHIFYGEGPYYIQTPLVSAVTEGLKTTTVSADGFYSTGPILSGGVNIDTLHVNISGDTMTGQLNVPTISAQSLSADDLTLANTFTGTFTDNDSNTVTVKNGIIISVA